MHSPDPRALLTPAMRRVLEGMARANRMPFEALTPEQARVFYNSGSGILDIPAHKMERVQDVSIPTRDGTHLRARLFVPHVAGPHTALPVLLYFHGGGFTIGSVATHASLCCHLAHLAHCAVLSVDYRLAPEHKFPTAVNDAWDSLHWLHQQGSRLGLDTTRLAVGGDSAGGTLSAATALHARDSGIPLVLQLLFYPGCTSHEDTPSHHAFGKGFVLDNSSIEWFFNHYLRTPADRADWRFAPLQAPDFDGVAPVWLGLAECDPLFDGGVMLADRLRLAGVPVDLDIYRGVVHGFITMGRAIPEALQAHQDAARALRQAFAQ